MFHEQLKRNIESVQKRRKEFLRSKNPQPEQKYEQRQQEEAEITERTQKHSFNKKHARLMRQMFGLFYLTMFCNDLHLLVQTSRSIFNKERKLADDAEKEQAAAKKMMKPMNRNNQGSPIAKDPESPRRVRMVKLVRDAQKQRYVQDIMQGLVLPKIRFHVEFKYYEIIRKVHK